MANVAYLASALVMGMLVVAVGVATTRNRRWKTYSPSATPEGEWYDDARTGGQRTWPRLTQSLNVWIALYAVLAVGFGGMVVAFVNGPDTGIGSAITAGFGGLLICFLLIGVYAAARGNDHSSALATAESVVTLGMLGIIAIAARLIFGG